MSYNHINIEERAWIYQFLNLGMSLRDIAKALKRSPSTISREIKRNSSNIKVSGAHYIKYLAIKANKKYIKRRYNYHRKSKFLKDVIDYVVNKISEYWYPEQISNRSTDLVKEIPSRSTIYR